jgi:hypothetical protein
MKYFLILALICLNLIDYGLADQSLHIVRTFPGMNNNYCLELSGSFILDI